MMMENYLKLNGSKMKNNNVEKIVVYLFAAILISIMSYAFFQLFIA